MDLPQEQVGGQVFYQANERDFAEVIADLGPKESILLLVKSTQGTRFMVIKGR